VLGVAMLVALQYGADASDRQSSMRSRHLFERAEEAVLAYSLSNARLPCPSADTEGFETCDGNATGYLPYRTLGLPDAPAGKLRYGLDALQLATEGAAGFEVLVPVLHGAGDALVAEPVSLHAIATADNDHMVDFCAALERQRGSEGRTGNDVAFSMEVPGGFAGGKTVRRSKIWTALNCGALLSTAGRAHFTARLQAAVMRRAINDYRTQFDIAYGLYEWDFAQSHWFLANSAYSASKTLVKLEIARAAWLASLETKPEPAKAMLLAAGALATSALHTSVYASTLARGAANLSNARKNRDTLDRLAVQADALDRDIAVHALENASNFLFLPQQARLRQADGTPADIAAPAVDPRIEGLGKEARDYLDLTSRL
jgi:hypothetical protein